MSELKRRHINEVMDMFCLTKGDMNWAYVYYADDADKVIALLTDKANYNEYAYKLKSEELADTCRFYEDEIRRQKHKRCLRNAEGCKNKAWFYGEVHDRNAALTMWKWRKRWLELAEQFKDKEAK